MTDTVDQAIELYEEFTGQPGGVVDTVELPVFEGDFLGLLDKIAYTAVREGHTESYIHTFKPRARPELYITDEGLYFTRKGRYTFTDLGFTDDIYKTVNAQPRYDTLIYVGTLDRLDYMDESGILQSEEFDDLSRADCYVTSDGQHIVTLDYDSLLHY